MCGVFTVLLYGILILVHNTDSRAVNITNSWTLPQEDFGVFYRFFRDKISWFEADAVCQFHHANLVTVNNGQQFDAARAFLKELDVNEPIWIGLMRPQGVDKFSWTNSKPLSLITDYWAESLPISETPLCAVIDPAQDFRWHGLHCGGPEIASFLCEMNVPSWATNCSIRAMPSLTIQYMSDSGAIQLSRDCGDDGTRHMICHGKEDHETIMKQLSCSDENNYVENNAIKLENELSIEKKIIKHPVSGEKNAIFSNKIDENLNQREFLESMQSDQPVNEKSNLKFNKFVKKLIATNTVKNLHKNINDELMQGDQPIGSIQDVLTDDSQFVEILPHIKKNNNPNVHISAKSLSSANAETSEDLEIAISPSTTHETIVVSTSDEPTQTTYLNSLTSSIVEGEFVTNINDISLSTINDKFTTSDNTISFSDNVTKRAIISIENNAHPMHAPRDIIKHTKNDFVATHVSHSHASKHGSKTISIGDDHFVPPMLLLKAKFTSRPHSEHEHSENQTNETTSNNPLIDHLNFTLEPKEVVSNITINNISMEFPATSTEYTKEKSEDSIFLNNSGMIIKTLTSNKLHISSTGIETHLDGKILKDDRIVEDKLGTDLPIISLENNKPIISSNTTEQPMDLASIFTLNDIQVTTPPPPSDMKENVTEEKNKIIQTNLPILSSIIISTNTSSINHTPNPIIFENTSSENKLPETTTISSVDTNNETTNKHSEYENSFSNVENFQPYKPNRRRSLIKIDAIPHSYIKKILG